MKKREQLKVVLEKFDRVPVDDYMNMIVCPLLGIMIINVM